MNFKMYLKFRKIQFHTVKVQAYIRITFLRRQIFRFCTAAFYPEWQWRYLGLFRELNLSVIIDMPCD